MISTVERRQPESNRIPFGIPVALSHEDFEDAFEADAVDLSPGGLALRSACLPDIGAQLFCTFETVPGGTRVSSRGEVVWTHLTGERSGEFGLRFLDIDADARALIDEMVAERNAGVLPHGNAQRQAPSATLDVDGVGAPLDAQLTHAGGGAAVFEQRLDLLELGRGVVAHAGAALGRGNIAEVTLHMQGDVPVLSVTVRFDGGQSLFGEFDWDPSVAEQNASDTARDLPAPQLAAAESRAPEADQQHAAAIGAQRTSAITMTEFHASTENEVAFADEAHTHELLRTVADGEAEALPPALTLDEQTAQDDETDAETAAEEDQDDDVLRASSAEQDAEQVSRAADGRLAHHERAAASDREAPRIIITQARPRVAETDEADAWAHPVPDFARSSVLVRFLRIFAAIVATAQRWLAVGKRLIGPAAKKSLEISRGAAEQSLHSAWLATARSFGRGQWEKLRARPRRVTAAPAALRKTQREDRGVLRMAAMAALGLCALGLGVYALAPTSEDTMIPVHRAVEAQPAPTAPALMPAPTAPATPTDATAATTPGAPGANVATTAPASAAQNAAAQALPSTPQPNVAVPAATTALNPAYAQTMLGNPPPTAAAASPDTPPAATARPSAAVPAVRTVPAGSPYAVDVHDSARVAPAAPKPATPSTGAWFGAKSVPNAQRFVLRMNAPIKSLEGKAERDGFTLIVRGSLAVDRAGPIKASHKSIAHAAVLNKGDHSELTIRFVDGKHPAYRITARGSELELLLAP
ncbi:MAG TPA: PilZ domain-containing protein [Polyangiales bacterium]